MSKFKQLLKKIPTGKEFALSFQHMFAMLGATITVPLIVGMSIPLALLGAGVGTLLFYFVTKRKVPVFLGSSFAYLPGLLTIISQGSYDKSVQMLAIMLALAGSGFIFMIFSVIIKLIGVEKIKKLFPPIVVGPVIIVIGMNLAGTIFWNNIMANTFTKTISDAVVNGVATTIVTGFQSSPDAWKHWTTAILVALTIVGINTFAKPKSFLKVIPILIGIVVGYVFGACVGLIDFDPTSANFVFQQTAQGNIVIFQMAGDLWGHWGAWAGLDGTLMATAMISILPIALVTFMEHLGDIAANSTICKKDFMVDPGLHRTILGDGIATMASALLGGPEITTYGENTAVLVITKNYDPKNIAMAACWAIFLAIFVPVGEIIAAMPSAVVGGACVVLFGMIAASGLKALVENKVDFGNNKNLIIVSLTLSIGLGLGAVSLGGDIVGALSNYALDGNIAKLGFATVGGGFVAISPLAIATILAIVLNVALPNDKTEQEIVSTELISTAIPNNENEEDGNQAAQE